MPLVNHKSAIRRLQMKCVDGIVQIVFMINKIVRYRQYIFYEGIQQLKHKKAFSTDRILFVYRSLMSPEMYKLSWTYVK